MTTRAEFYAAVDARLRVARRYMDRAAEKIKAGQFAAAEEALDDAANEQAEMLGEMRRMNAEAVMLRFDAPEGR